MTHVHKFAHTIYLGLLASMFIGGPALGEIKLPSAVELERSVYFQNLEGEPVQFQPGIYEVGQHGEKALAMVFVGAEIGDPTPIQAIPAGHDQPVEANTAHLLPSPDNHADKQHLVFLTPEGLALESVGSYSGVFTRSALTWGQEVSETQGVSDDPLTVDFDQAIHFKTIGGDPKAVQPGAYEVAMAGNGLVLTPAGNPEGEPITVEAEPLGTSTATLLPDFNDNPDLELLLVATAQGQSVVAIGSHSGTFPRGILGRIKGGVKNVVGSVKDKVKDGARKGYRFAKGEVKDFSGRVSRGYKKWHKGKMKFFYYSYRFGRFIGKQARKKYEKKWKMLCLARKKSLKKCLSLPRPADIPGDLLRGAASGS